MDKPYGTKETSIRMFLRSGTNDETRRLAGVEVSAKFLATDDEGQNYQEAYEDELAQVAAAALRAHFLSDFIDPATLYYEHTATRYRGDFDVTVDQVNP